MPWISKAPARRGLASTSTLARIQDPSASSASRSRTGPRALHGPHQPAQKSTTTGTWWERSMTSETKVSSVTSTTDRETLFALISVHNTPKAADLPLPGSFQVEHEGEEAGDGLVEVGRDGLAELAGGVQRPGQGNVADDRDVVLL